MGIFDLTSFGKIEVSGPGALALLERVCDARIDRPVGRVVYTQFLNSDGGIVADLTVTRLDEDRFRLVTGAAAVDSDRGWLELHADGNVEIRDVSDELAVIGIWGPRARDVLTAVSGDDVSGEALPFSHAREIAVGRAAALAQRITFVGELGFELYVAPEWAVQVWDRLMAAGREHGIRAGGYRVLESLRIEKGYRYFGTDLTASDTPYEGGVGFCVAGDKDFIGAAALAGGGAASPAADGRPARRRVPLRVRRRGRAHRRRGRGPRAHERLRLHRESHGDARDGAARAHGGHPRHGRRAGRAGRRHRGAGRPLRPARRAHPRLMHRAGGAKERPRNVVRCATVSLKLIPADLAETWHPVAGSVGRSLTHGPGKHVTWKDCIAHLSAFVQWTGGGRLRGEPWSRWFSTLPNAGRYAEIGWLAMEFRPRNPAIASSDGLGTLDLQEMAHPVDRALLDVRERGAEELGDLHPQRLGLRADHG